MKRIVALLLALAMVLSLAACGGKTNEPAQQQPAQQQPVQSVQSAVQQPAAEQAAKPVFCAQCGKKNDAQARFCMACGASIPEDAPAPAPESAPSQRAFCMNCGNPLRPGDKFCMKCGTRV